MCRNLLKLHLQGAILGNALFSRRQSDYVFLSDIVCIIRMRERLKKQ